MLLKQLFDSNTATYTYLLADPDSLEAVIIDPVLEHVARDLKLIAELNLKLVHILETHLHADHITGSGSLRKATQASIGISAATHVACADRQLQHGDTIDFGSQSLKVCSTPGHTDGCLTFVANTDTTAQNCTIAFTGDALLIRGCGRTDFQQGDAATLYRSVHTHIYSLPKDTLIYPGHDYRGHTVSTVLEEQTHNPRLKCDISEASFIEIMQTLNLAHPKQIDKALPANMACGLLETTPTHPSHAAFKEIDAASLEHHTIDRVIDVRSLEEFHGPLGHLPNAELVPLPELAEHAQTWSPHEAILLVCRSGRRSAQACTLLAEMGFLNLTNLVGGMQAWRAQQEKVS